MSRSEYTAFQCLARAASEQEDWRQVLAKRDTNARHWHQRRAQAKVSLFQRISTAFIRFFTR